MLRAAIAEVERVVIGSLYDVGRASPGRIEASHQVPTVEGPFVEFVTDLLSLRDARVEDPPVGLAGRAAAGAPVDVNGGEERQPTACVEHDAEVVVSQLVRVLASV